MTLTKRPGQLLIVEDDPDLRETLEDYFSLAGYAVTTTALAQGFRALLDRQDFDLILLDLNLPDGDGLKLLRDLRRVSTVPALVITGRRDQESRLSALELEADDFINKPFVLRELALRVRNCLSRYHHIPDERLSQLGRWLFYPRQQCLRLATRADAPDAPEIVMLTAGETVCLRTLLGAQGRLVTSPQLLAALETTLGQAEAESLPVMMSRLRQKLRLTLADINLNPIENIPRQGYRIRLPLWESPTP
ncbi:MAG: response regulator transcription factor [Desulfuromonadaceae bacterium]|nr:response regulator transcription factor [Desulfuromonadaceae bacterium]